jgi:glycosyltransferase involved in cell wall biosynthesis
MRYPAMELRVPGGVIPKAEPNSWSLESFAARIRLPHTARDAENAAIVAESDLCILSSPPTVGEERHPRMLFAIHVSRDANTAVYKNTRDRVAYLERQGWQCTIVSPDDFPWIRHLGGRFTPLTFPVALACWLFRHADAFDFASFHSYAGWAVGSLSRLFGRFRRLRTVIQFHGLEPLYYARLKAEAVREGRPLSWRYRLVSGRIMRNLLRRACRRADLVLCLNSEEVRFLVEQEWAEANRVRLVANPAPLSFFIDRLYGQSVTKLLFVGQWLKMKGTRTLVEAFTQLHRDRPEIQLICAGTMANAETVLRDFPSDVRQHVSVHSRVRKSELLDLHREADLFVFPTLSEGFSLALIEAMASGLPIITTPVGAAPDILQDGHSVVFCPANEPATLVNNIVELLSDQLRRERLGRSARQAAEKFRPDTVWKEYARSLNQLAQRDLEQHRRIPVADAIEGD